MACSISLSKTTYRAGSAFADIEESHVKAELNAPIITINNSLGAVSVSDNGAGGVFTAVSGISWAYTPANNTKNVLITVRDSNSNASANLAVTASFPIQPNFGYDYEPQSLTQSIFAKDNTPRFRRSRKKAISWNLQMLNRTIMDAAVIQSFFDYHDIDLEFWYIDVELQTQVLVRFDSAPKVRVVGGNNFEIACIVKAHSTIAPTLATSYGNLILKVDLGAGNSPYPGWVGETGILGLGIPFGYTAEQMPVVDNSSVSEPLPIEILRRGTYAEPESAYGFYGLTPLKQYKFNLHFVALLGGNQAMKIYANNQEKASFTYVVKAVPKVVEIVFFAVADGSGYISMSSRAVSGGSIGFVTAIRVFG